MIRAEIRLTTAQDIANFVSALNADGTPNHFTIVNEDGTLSVNARSYLGTLYAATEFGRIFLINQTEDGKFPSGIDNYRA